MRKPKCIDCGRPAERLACNSCSTIISVCPEHRVDYFLQDDESSFACVDCAGHGNGLIRHIKGRERGAAARRK